MNCCPKFYLTKLLKIVVKLFVAISAVYNLIYHIELTREEHLCTAFKRHSCLSYESSVIDSEVLIYWRIDGMTLWMYSSNLEPCRAKQIGKNLVDCLNLSTMY